MKKTATVLIMLAVLLFMTNGIAQVQLGIQAGANFGSFSMDPEISGLDLGSRTGLVIGGIFSYNFSPMLALQVEPAYVQKGGTMTLEETEEGMSIKMVSARCGLYRRPSISESGSSKRFSTAILTWRYVSGISDGRR